MKSLDRNQLAYAIASEWNRPTLLSVASLAQGYPIELRTLGTLQTLAFSMGKRDTGHDALARAVARWVLSPKSGAPLGEVDEDKRVPSELLRRLAGAERAEYLAADAEAVAFADAIKTISKALNRQPGQPRAGGRR